MQENFLFPILKMDSLAKKNAAHHVYFAVQNPRNMIIVS